MSHAGSVASVEDDIEAAGAAIIWVVQETNRYEPGLVEHCEEFRDSITQSTTGFCVGDGETQPEPGVFHTSPFADSMGFDIVVERATMDIVFATSHGIGGDNENLDGQALVELLQGLE